MSFMDALTRETNVGFEFPDPDCWHKSGNDKCYRGSCAIYQISLENFSGSAL